MYSAYFRIVLCIVLMLFFFILLFSMNTIILKYIPHRNQEATFIISNPQASLFNWVDSHHLLNTSSPGSRLCQRPHLRQARHERHPRSHMVQGGVHPRGRHPRRCPHQKVGPLQRCLHRRLHRWRHPQFGQPHRPRRRVLLSRIHRRQPIWHHRGHLLQYALQVWRRRKLRGCWWLHHRRVVVG